MLSTSNRAIQKQSTFYFYLKLDKLIANKSWLLTVCSSGVQLTIQTRSDWRFSSAKLNMIFNHAYVSLGIQVLAGCCRYECFIIADIVAIMAAAMMPVNMELRTRG